MVHVHAGGNQQAHGLGVAALGRRNQCGAAKAVGAAQVRPVRQRQLQDGQLAFGAGQQKRAVALGVLRIHVGACQHQLLCQGGMAQRSGQQQGAAALGVARLQLVQALGRGQQRLQAPQVLLLDGGVQGGAAVLRAGRRSAQGGGGYRGSGTGHENKRAHGDNRQDK